MFQLGQYSTCISSRYFIRMWIYVKSRNYYLRHENNFQQITTNYFVQLQNQNLMFCGVTFILYMQTYIRTCCLGPNGTAVALDFGMYVDLSAVAILLPSSSKLYQVATIMKSFYGCFTLYDFYLSADVSKGFRYPSTLA